MAYLSEKSNSGRFPGFNSTKDDGVYSLVEVRIIVLSIIAGVIDMSSIKCRTILSFLILLSTISLSLFPAVDTGRDADVDALSKYGSSGSEVRNIQTRLRDWGYYTGEIDGIYGSRTVAAVKWFQKNNGLSADGICGPMTLAAIGLPTGGSSGGYSSSEIDLLARMISAESRGEPYTGQVAVGAVILNRVEHPSFPNSISGVCYQSGAFSSVYDGQINLAPTDSSKRAAMDALNGWDPTGGAIYFYNPRTAKSEWIRSRPVIRTIGNHVFCS